jgi:hypothetical protein
MSSKNKTICKQKRLNIKLETKYKIIQLIDKKTPVSEILETFKDEIRGDYSISKIKKEKAKIIEEYKSSTSTQVKSLKKSKYPVIEKGLIEFISKCNNEGIPINTLLLKEKTNRLANENSINNFKASNGFISRLKDRNAIIFQTFHGESDGVPDD